MEKDNEMKGIGNSINYQARIYDTRLARFLSIGPLTADFPWYTPYQFAGNKPIVAIDLDGLEEYIIHPKYLKLANGTPFLHLVSFKYTNFQERGISDKGSALFVDRANEVTVDFGKDYLRDKTIKDVKTQGINTLGQEQRNAFIHAENARKSQGTGLGRYGKARVIIPRVKMNYGNDEGQKIAEVTTQFNSLDRASKNNLEKMIAVLVYEKNTTMTINGIASPKASNNRRTTTLSSLTNEEIAKNRANAAKEFIIKYACDNYGEEIHPDRINTSSTIQNSGDPNNPNSNLQEDRGATFQLNNQNTF